MKFPNAFTPVLTLLFFISTSLQFETKHLRERKFDGIVSVLKKYLPDQSSKGERKFDGIVSVLKKYLDANEQNYRCGVPAIQPKLDKRIVGGEPATAHAWPWQVRVQHRRSAIRWGDTCGGTIISREYVLTAAHCVYDKPGGKFREEDVRVVAGDDDRSVDETDGSIQVMTVSKIFIQDGYEFETDLNDIAILRLTNQLTFNSNVSRCCLATSEPTLESFCYATGWGDTRGTGDRSKLYQVRLPIIAEQTCKKSGYYGSKIKESMMCAGYEKGGRDTCQGDSGGPLVCQHGDQWDLHGITSWGEGCAEPKKPGVYTKVHLFLDWIKEITGVSPLAN